MSWSVFFFLLSSSLHSCNFPTLRTNLSTFSCRFSSRSCVLIPIYTSNHLSISYLVSVSTIWTLADATRWIRNFMIYARSVKRISPSSHEYIAVMSPVCSSCTSVLRSASCCRNTVYSFMTFSRSGIDEDREHATLSLT